MRTPSRAILALVLVLVLALPTVALAGGDDPTPTVALAGGDDPTPAGASASQRVKIVDDRFRPGTITIARGTVVKWVNRGDNRHTTTSSTGLWDSGRLDPGESFRRRFRQEGIFRYTCTVHFGMNGTITVT